MAGVIYQIKTFCIALDLKLLFITSFEHVRHLLLLHLKLPKPGIYWFTMAD